MAIVENIAIYRGEDIQLNFKMSPATDITGWTIVMTIKQAPTTAVLDTLPATLTAPTTGEFEINLPHAVTNITARAYVWDVVRTDPGSEKVLATGGLTIKSGVRTP